MSQWIRDVFSAIRHPISTASRKRRAHQQGEAPFVGRIAGEDSGYREETGAEARQRPERS